MAQKVISVKTELVCSLDGIGTPHHNILKQFQEKGVGFQFLNSLLLSARFLIYRCKYSNTKPNMLQYFNSLSITKQTEYIIAKKNSKLDKHFRKWYFIGAPV